MKLKLIILFACFPALFGQIQVSNGRTPEGGAKKLVFVEDLRIGNDCEEDHCLWSGANVSVSVNRKGEMFVTDPGSNRIVVYDARGKHLKTFGRSGQGPGEFTQLYSYQILADQTGVAFDNNQSVLSFSYFDADQKYLDKTTLQPGKRFIQAAYFSPSGRRIAAMFVEPNSDPNRAGKVFCGLIDQKTEPLLILTQETQVMFDHTKMDDGSWWSQFLADWFKVVQRGVGIMAFAESGEIFTAVSNQYKIIKYSRDLKPQAVITKDYKPIGMPEDQLLAFVEPVHEEIVGILPPEMRRVVTTSVVEKALELAEFPPRKQPVFGLMPVEDKGFLVIHNYDPLTKKTHGDLFSIKGKFLGSSELPPIDVNIFAGFFGSTTRIIFQDGFAYIILANESGERHLVRYKYSIEG